MVVQPGNNFYQLICLSNDGRQSNTRTVAVNGVELKPKIYSFYYMLAPGGNGYSVHWNADADQCALDGQFVNSSGSQGFLFIIQGSQHTLFCEKSGRTVSNSIIIN